MRAPSFFEKWVSSWGERKMRHWLQDLEAMRICQHTQYGHILPIVLPLRASCLADVRLGKRKAFMPNAFRRVLSALERNGLGSFVVRDGLKRQRLSCFAGISSIAIMRFYALSPGARFDCAVSLGWRAGMCGSVEKRNRRRHCRRRLC